MNLSSIHSTLIRKIGDRIGNKKPNSRKICIINYHRILSNPDPLLRSEPDKKLFHSQMRLLSDSFNVIPLYKAIEHLRSGTMPPRAVAITFDDGYQSTHDIALPILVEYRLSATVFITGNGSLTANMWNDRIIEAIRHIKSKEIDLREFGLPIYSVETSTQRRIVLESILNTSKYLPATERSALVEQVEFIAQVKETHIQMLSSEMIKTLASSGCEIGGHTVSHPILAKIDDVTATKEIVDNKKYLEKLLDKRVRLFAYPNGKFGKDFGQNHIEIVRNLGYEAAFTTAHGAASGAHNQYLLPRSRPWDKSQIAFALRLLRWLASTDSASP